MTDAIRDENHVTVALGVSSTNAAVTLPFKIDSATGRLLTDAASGSGTVTSVSVVTANGFAGTVATATTTPAITLTTTVTGILIGNGTAISAATPGTDYTALAFKTIAVSGQSDVVADTAADTLTLVGSGVTITTNAATDTITFTVSAASIVIGTTVITSGTNTRILYNNSGVVGEYTITGSGTVVAMQTAPTFVTSITTPSVLATSNDSGALGAAATAFSDLFLASGALIGFANGNAVITHSSGIISVTTGEFRITSANVGTNADSVPTLSSTSTLTNKTLTAPTLGGAGVMAAGATLNHTIPTVDGTATGPTTNAFVSGYSSSAVGDLVYLDSNGKWQKTDSDSLSTTTGLLGIALAVAAADAALLVALPGSMVYATAFPTLTIGAPYYVGETAGAIQSAIPTGADNAVRVVGFGIHADKLYFNPSPDTSTTVA